MLSVTAPTSHYRRRAHCVFRALDNRVWVGSPGRATVAVEGSAVFVWLVLEQASSLADLTSEIRRTWPELTELTEQGVDEALRTLMDADLVESTDADQVPASAPSEA